MDPVEESSETESKLTLDTEGDDTFLDVQDGDYACITIWGNVKKEGAKLEMPQIERAQLMPEGYGEPDDDDEDEEGTTDEAPVRSRPKTAVAILIGEKPKSK